MRREIRSVSRAIAEREKQEIRSWNNQNRINNHKRNDKVKLAWFAPTDEPKSKDTFYQDVWEQVKLYLNNSSLAGYKYMVDTRRTLCERIIWVVLHGIMMSVFCVIVWNVWFDYKHTPVVTVVDSYHYPSNYLPLPAVSVCTINRISRQAVVGLAERIKSSNATKLPIDSIISLLYNLGYLYESSDTSDNSENKKLDDLLKSYFGVNYELTQLMKELTPQCTDVLIKCRFRFENRNCSELFFFRKTMDGFCCIFNYARATDDILGPTVENYYNEVYKVEKLGQINGLTFLMEPFLDDYFFPILPISGWKITIFNAGDYSDNTSGGVADALISPSTENFLELNGASFYSKEAVRNYEVEKRKCIFHDEVSALYDGYTYSDCIVDCKVNDIWNNCGCRPFYFPKRDERRVCNISDVECLYKFKSKWWSVLPHDINSNSEESEIFNFISNESWSLHCKNCYPSCNDVHYYLQTSNVNLQKENQTSFLRDVKIADQSLVHIFFAKYGTIRLRQDVAYYWYELLSNIGGICGVFIGFSFISIVELIYFILLSVSVLWKNNEKIKSIDELREPIPTRQVRTLYWSELAPRGKIKTQEINPRRYTVFSYND